MSPGTKTHSLLATARIANVPSVLSNLGVGVLLGCAQDGTGFHWPWLLSIAAILFYVSGNFFNDWQDREWDKTHRPERALPRGLFSEKSYLIAAIVGMSLGLGLAAFHGLGVFIVASVLVWLIWFYTKIHKRTALSVIPMGLCRACLPLLGFVAMRGGIEGSAFVPALALLLYIVALSLSARWESRGDVSPEKKWQARGMLAGSGLIAAALPLLISPALGWTGLIPFGIWLTLCLTKYRAPIPAHVSALLAGIPLVDWVILFPMAWIWLHLQRVEATDGMFLTALLLPPFAFIAGRALQRLAPAT